MDRTEFLKIASSLSPEEKAAVFGQTAARSAPAAHKWSHLADALSEGDVKAAVNACRAGLTYVASHTGEDDAEGKGLQFLRDVAPALAAASEASCRFRGKPPLWGLTRIPEYLQSETFAQKRAAAARRVPVAAPASSFGATPASEVPAVKGIKS